MCLTRRQKVLRRALRLEREARVCAQGVLAPGRRQMRAEGEGQEGDATGSGREGQGEVESGQGRGGPSTVSALSPRRREPGELTGDETDP